MSGQHTPGPWRACHEGECVCGQVWSTTADHPVAEVTRGEWGDPGCVYGEVHAEAAKANARLIAAAPELLEALRYAEAFISIAVPEFKRDRDEAVNDVLPQIRAALAKAVAGAAAPRPDKTLGSDEADETGERNAT